MAPNAASRKRLIAKLPETNPALHDVFVAEKRRAEGVSHLLRMSGRYPLAGRGDINTYAVFAESNRNLLGGTGRLGVILPTGIATDATTQYFFKDLVEHGSIASLYDFENRKPLFDAVDSRFKFCLLTLVGRDLREPEATFAFFAHDPTDLLRADATFTLTPEEITLLNPNTGTCPVFRSRRDAEITLGIYKRVPVLVREGDPDGNPWGIKFMTMFHMSNDSYLFHTREELEDDGWVLNGNVFELKKKRMLPLYEAKMIDMYDHRAADVVKSETATKRQNQPRYLSEGEHEDVSRVAIPLYWVADSDVPDADGGWRLAFLRITSPTNQRTFISSAIPPVAAGDSVFLIELERKAELLACFNSYAFDYVARQKLAGLNMLFYIVKQLPVIDKAVLTESAPWDRDATLSDWLRRRVARLNYVAVDMEPFAEALGVAGQPFQWNTAAREHIERELDAAFFHLYGVGREDVDYIMETFPIVKRKDIAAHGEYRTKRLILEAFDAMAEAEAAGVPYASPFDELNRS